MRSHGKLTLHSRAVKAQAVSFLTQSLPLRKPGSKCTSSVVYRIVLYAAAWATSLAAACEELVHEDVCDQAVRDALRRGLPQRIADLEKRLNEVITIRLPRGVLRQRRVVAIDLHLDPYYGEPWKNKNELYRSQPKQGTSDFHAYATVAIVEKGQRSTLGFTRVKAKEKMPAIVSRLLDLVAARGVRIRRVLLDRGFFSFDVMAELKSRKVSWLMPVAIRGRVPKHPKKATGFRALLQRRSGWYEHTLKKNSESLTFDVCVVRRLVVPKDRRRKRWLKPMLFASMGVRGEPRAIREQYRKRFGIETSYRQLRQAWAKTTSRDPWLRLLLLGMAIVLVNLWVWLRSLRDQAPEGAWSFERLLRELAYDLRREQEAEPPKSQSREPITSHA